MAPLYVTAVVIGLLLIALVKFNRATDFILWGGVGLLLIIPTYQQGAWSLGVLNATDALAGFGGAGIVAQFVQFHVASPLGRTRPPKRIGTATA